MRSKDGKMTFIIATHEFEKKSDKTPLQQIEKAERIKRYFQSANG